MARLVGNDGNFAWDDVTGDNTVNGKINTWSLTVSQVVTDVSAFGDSCGAKRGGIKEGRGSAAGVPSDDTANSAPNLDGFDAEGEAITLTSSVGDTGNTFKGTAIVSNATMSSTKTAEATLSFDFEFDGAVAEVWDET